MTTKLKISDVNSGHDQICCVVKQVLQAFNAYVNGAGLASIRWGGGR